MRLIYDTLTERLHPCPRADDGPIEGLASHLLVLEVIEPSPQPDPEATPVDTVTLTYDDPDDLERPTGGTITRSWQGPPRWVQFGLALGQDASMIEFVRAVNAANPILERMISGGLLQAAEGNPKTFMAAWSAGLAGGLVTPDLAAYVQALATSHALPEAFGGALNPPEVEA